MAKRAKQPSGGTPATDALAAAGVAFRLHSYEHDPAVTSYGDEAASALGIDPHRVFKTLVIELAAGPGRAGGQLAVAVVPVAAKLDLKAAASALGAKKADLAEPARATRSSGYLLGGISPLGQKTPLPTLVDDSARGFETIFVSAGRRGLQVELSVDDLARLTTATFADLRAVDRASRRRRG